MRHGREASLHMPNLKGQEELYVYFFPSYNKSIVFQGGVLISGVSLGYTESILGDGVRDANLDHSILIKYLNSTCNTK